MASIKLYTQDGGALPDLTASDAVFQVPLKEALVHQVVRTQLANRRAPIAHTKTRGEVRGGGKKPWKQKGTGRARHGSTRSPIWIGGGITFGPRSDRNFTLRLNKKMKKRAMCMALSAKVREGKLFALESLSIKGPKTKELSSLVKTWPEKGDLLLIVGAQNDNVQYAAKNIDSVWVSRPESLSIVDILKYRRIAVEASALPQLEKIFASEI